MNLAAISASFLLFSSAHGQLTDIPLSSLPYSPPYYPSPRVDGSGDWKAAYVKARDFVGQLTILEKVNLTTGTGWQSQACVGTSGSIPRLNFPSLCLQDGPLGVRASTYTSAFPAGLNAAMSWDRDLIYARGLAMGEEFKEKGINVILGPVAGPLGRHPNGGRNWEGFSADPVLTGVGIAETIKGIQDAGVIATAKHYIGNEQEAFRIASEGRDLGFNITESLSSNIDDRTMHELYAWPFADAVKAGVGAIMCSYNQVNNSYGCANSKLLNGLLKDELDFQGFVMSDWQAQHSGVASALAGLDMTMPGDTEFNTGGSFWGGNLTMAIVNGSIPEWRLDDMATRIMAAYFYVGQDPETFPETNFNAWTTDSYGYAHYYAKKGYGLINTQVDVRADHHKYIRQLSAKSNVLLKNEGVLPLTGNEKQIGIFGSDAGEDPLGPNACEDKRCDNGTLAMGWGSGSGNFPYLITPLEAIKARAVSAGSLVQSVINDYAYDQIRAVARQASVCLTFVNADSGEGFITVDNNKGDRRNLTLWHDGETLIKTVTSQCNNTVVVIHAVGPVLVESFVDNPNVTAIIFAGLPGQESGNAITDVLYGDINPSGKLPFTIGKSFADYGVSIAFTTNVTVPQEDFAEGLLIDYRHFDAKGIKPRYEFGYGISYTTFEHSNLRVAKVGTLEGYTPAAGTSPGIGSNRTIVRNPKDFFPPPGFDDYKIPNFIYPYLSPNDSFVKNGTYDAPPGAYDTASQPIPAAGGAPGGNPSLYDTVYTVTVTVTNTGGVAGEEVVQLYLETGLEDDPVQVLRGFEKVPLNPGQSKDVEINLNRRDLGRWDIVKQDWTFPAAARKVKVGSSSRNTPLVADLA